MQRRSMIVGMTAAGAVLVATQGRTGDATRIPRLDDEWRERLTDAQFKVMRRGYNELAGTSGLAWERRAGTYRCRGCLLEIYTSRDKINDQTGWPSFRQPIAGRVAVLRNWRFFGIGKNIRCTRCGSHLGVVVPDAALPTGRRHRLNGIAMVFRPA